MSNDCGIVWFVERLDQSTEADDSSVPIAELITRQTAQHPGYFILSGYSPEDRAAKLLSLLTELERRS